METKPGIRQFGYRSPPAEVLIIAGAALGTLLIGNPPRILKRIVQSIGGVVTGSKFNQARYVDSLKMIFELLYRHAKMDWSLWNQTSKSRKRAGYSSDTPNS
jgi:flagellar motor component MotA